MAVGDDAVERRAGATRLYRERMAELMADVDLLVTPTLEVVAPPAGVGDLALREQAAALTFPFNASARPRSRCPAGRPSTGCRPPSQLVGRPGEDAWCSPRAGCSSAHELSRPVA